jgi:CheY-like chemotaxis protein
LIVATALRKATVLVVEDDSDLRELYRSALVAAGYAVVSVADGLDALNRIETDLPELVVLDMALPLLGGRDVQHELKARPDLAHIPIVVVSGTDTRDLDPRGFDRVLRKPIDPDQLVGAVENCLREAWRYRF